MILHNQFKFIYITITIIIIILINQYSCLEITFDYYSTQLYNNSECGIISLNEPPCNSIVDINNRIFQIQQQLELQSQINYDNILILNFIFNQNQLNQISYTTTNNIYSINPFIFNNITIQSVINNSSRNNDNNNNSNSSSINSSDKRFKINGDRYPLLNFDNISNSSHPINVRINGFEFTNFYQIVLLGYHIGSVEFSNCNFFQVYSPIFSNKAWDYLILGTLSIDRCNFTQSSGDPRISLKQVRDGLIITNSIFTMQSYFELFFTNRVVVRNSTFINNQKNIEYFFSIGKVNNLELSDLTIINNYSFNSIVAINEERYLDNYFIINNIAIHNNFNIYSSSKSNNNIFQINVGINSLNFNIKNISIIKNTDNSSLESSASASASASTQQQLPYSNFIELKIIIDYQLYSYNYYMYIDNITSNYPFNNFIVSENSKINLSNLNIHYINQLVFGKGNTVNQYGIIDSSLSGSSNNNNNNNNDNSNQILKIVLPLGVVFIIVLVSVSIFIAIKFHQNNKVIKRMKQQIKLQTYYIKDKVADVEVITVKSWSTASNFDK